MAEQGRISVKFTSDTTDFQKGNKQVQGGIKKTEGSIKKFSAGLKTLAPAIGAAFAVTAITKFAGASIKMFDEQARAMAKVETAVRQTGGAAGFTAKELQATAAELQKITTFGDEDILNNVTAQLLTFTNIGQEQFKRTQMAALNLSTVLDGDLKSASIQLGKALNDPVANLSALSRSGIQFSDSQTETIKRLAQTNQLAEAQTVILDELNKQYGGQAEAQAKIGLGPWKQIRNQVGDMREEMGARLLPVINKVGEFVLKLLPLIQSGMAKAREKVRTVANAFIDVYNNSQLLRVGIGLMVGGIKTTFAGIKLIIQNAFLPIKTFGKVVGAILKGDFKAIGGIIKEGFAKGVENVGEFGKKAVDNYSNAIKKARDNFIEPLSPNEEDTKTVESNFKALGQKAAGAFGSGLSKEPMTVLATKEVSSVSGGEVDEKGIVGAMRSIQEETEITNAGIDALTNGAMAFGNAMMQAGAEGEDGLKGFAKTALSTAKKVIAAELAQGVASAVASALKSVPFPFNIAAGGIAGGLAAALFNSAIPSFAEGGMVSSPTLAMIGDAKDGRPEYVLNSGQMDNLTKGGTLYTEISGRNLRIILDRENSFIGRT